MYTPQTRLKYIKKRCNFSSTVNCCRLKFIDN